MRFTLNYSSDLKHKLRVFVSFFYRSGLVLSSTSRTWWWMVFGCRMDSCRRMKGSQWSFSLLFILELERFNQAVTLRHVIILCYYTYCIQYMKTVQWNSFFTNQNVEGSFISWKAVLVFLSQGIRFSKKSIIGCIRNVRFNNVLIGEPAVNHGGAPCFDGAVEEGAYFTGGGSHMILGQDFIYNIFHFI